MTLDIRVNDYGSIVLLDPVTKRGRLWLEEHALHEGDYQPYWPSSLLGEPRYVSDLLGRAVEAGLEVG